MSNADLPRPELALPPRPADAPSGSEFARRIMGMTGAQRDAAIAAEIMRGNVPESMRELHPVQLGNNVIFVTPDYISIGTDEDNIRVPVGMPAALSIAAASGAILPTTGMVDAIVREAERDGVRLTPQPMDPTSAMTSTDYFVRQDRMTDTQFERAGGEAGELTAGHRKDLVIDRVASHPQSVAIYGWQQGNGHNIQPLSTVHGEEYADYSHGVRLVSRHGYNAAGELIDTADLLSRDQFAAFTRRSGLGAAVVEERYAAASLTPPEMTMTISTFGTLPDPAPEAPAVAATAVASSPIPRARPDLSPASGPETPPVAETTAPAAPPVAEAAADAPAPDAEAPAETAAVAVMNVPALRAQVEAGRMVRHGSNGEQVRELQAFLNEHGYVDPQGEALETDGVFGPRTAHALREFQRDQGIQVDGVVGPQTMGRINQTNLMAAMDLNHDAIITLQEIQAEHGEITVEEGAADVTIDGVAIPLNTPNPTLERSAAAADR